MKRRRAQSFGAVVTIAALLARAAWADSTVAQPGATPDAGAHAASAPPSFIEEIEAFEASDRVSPPPKGATLFLGSSSIRRWTTLAQDFPRHTVINRGFGGSVIRQSLLYAPRIVFPYEPRAIFFYAGTNDIAGGATAEAVFADYQAFARAVLQRLPRTKLWFISAATNPSRWSQVDRVRRLNQLVVAFSKTDARLGTIDVHTAMLRPDGTPKPEIFGPDRLHMNATGYALWTRVIAPYLGPPDRPR